MNFDAEAYIDAALTWLDMPLDAAARPGVKMNLEIAARLATLVLEFPLDDEAEPAPVYAP
jgi:hypothetical protein